MLTVLQRGQLVGAIDYAEQKGRSGVDGDVPIEALCRSVEDAGFDVVGVAEHECLDLVPAHARFVR
ncbi:hypothetical protein GCM10023352_17910 [Rothia endophytica]|uniref:Uncharacterized protein n=1 Tax=Rothia endophytica TaxID=1324766 RepID=A0ABP9BQ31_9MICC